MHKANGARRPRWLIVKHDISRVDVLTIDLGGDGETLAVFSFQEEAQMFLNLRPAASREGWSVRQTSVGELVSVLYGPCSGAKKVALDPIPEIVDTEELIDLLSMHRNDFLQFLLGEAGPSNLHVVPSRARGPQARAKNEHVA
jgi:hypothetical protein